MVARRRGHLLGAETVVRWSRGSYCVTTLSIPGGSLKSIRLGWWRWQRCPVGQHWTFVTPARVSDLTEDDLDLASRTHDVRIP